MIGFMKAIADVITDAKYRSDLEQQIQQLEAGRPAGAPNSGDQSWQTYRRTLTRMTLQVCGTRPFKNYR
jgi:hypothetical protein